jgi:type II secretory pathway component PulF
MDPRTGARVRRLESVEIGAVAVIVLASVVQGFFLYRLVPVLASLYASSGETLSLPLRLYIGLCNWSLILVPVVLMVWMGFQIAGRSLPATIRRKVLMVVAVLAGPVTIVGLYFMAEDSLLQAMRLSSALAASAQVRERDLST